MLYLLLLIIGWLLLLNQIFNNIVLMNLLDVVHLKLFIFVDKYLHPNNIPSI